MVEPIQNFGKEFLAFARQQHGVYDGLEFEGCALAQFVINKGFKPGAWAYFPKEDPRYVHEVARFPEAIYPKMVLPPDGKSYREYCTWEALVTRLEALDAEGKL